MNYLSIDVGTTGCKCQLFSETGDILAYDFREYDFKDVDGLHYVDVDAIEMHLRDMIAKVAADFKVDSVAVSSLGEAFVLMDREDNILFYPMLYTDPRGEAEAEHIKATVGEARAFAIAGVVPHSMYSLSKLLWIKNNYPDLYAKADKVMLIGDYIGYLLTGERVIDYALASRTGVFDVTAMQFSRQMLDALGIDAGLFSKPAPSATIVGKIKPEWGIDAVLVLGAHDQVSTALGAGVLQEGDAVDGMGTVECITTLFRGKPDSLDMGKQGYPCVPYPVDGLYCTYILNYSCGSTVNWLRKRIMHGYHGEEDSFFAYMEKQMTSAPTGLLTLPYFGGAATPYQDLGARGAILNLTTDTPDWQLYKSVMEGTAFEMRLNAETVAPYGITVKQTVATGGGATSDTWLRTKADIGNVPIKTLRSSEGGLCGLAVIQAVAMGGLSWQAARDIFVRYDKAFAPNEENHRAYEPYYQKYKKIYKALKEI